MRPIIILILLCTLPFTAFTQPHDPMIAPDTAAQVVELERWGRGLIYDLAWTPTDDLAAASQIGIWLYTAGGEELMVPRSTADQPSTLSIDGTHAIALTSGTQIAVVPLDGGPARAISTAGAYERYTLDLNADNTILLGVDAADGSASVWDARSGSLISRFAAGGPVTIAALNPAGTIAATTVTRSEAGSFRSYNVIQLWDAATGTAIAELVEDDMRMVTDLEFSPDGALLAAAAINSVFIWDVAQADQVRRLPTAPFVPVPEGEQPIMINEFLAWSPDGARLAVSSTDQTYLLTSARAAGLVNGVQIWDAATGEVLTAPPAQSGFGGPVAWNADGDRLAYAGYDGTLRIWSAANGAVVRTVARDHYGSAGDVLVIRPDGALVTGSFERMLRVWRDGELLAQSAPHTGAITAIAISPDGTQIASASRFDTIIDQGDERRRLDLRAADPFALAFDAAGERLYGVSGLGQTLWLWTTPTTWQEAPVETQFNLPAPVSAAALDPDRGRAAVALGVTVQIYALAEGKLEAEFTLPTSATALIYHPADPGLLIAGLTDGQLLAYRGADGAFVARIANAHDNAIFDLAFDPAGMLLATASADETIRLWPADLNDDSLPLAALEGHIDAVTDLVWSQDGTRLYSGSWDTTIRVWGLPQR